MCIFSRDRLARHPVRSRRPLGVFAVLISLAIGMNAVAAVGVLRDLPGVADPPDLPRYAGAVLIGQARDQVQDLALPKGPWGGSGREADWSASLTLSGQRERLLYLAPPEVRAEAVAEVYRDRLAAAGYQLLFSCEGAGECGAEVGRFYSSKEHGHQLGDDFVLQSAFAGNSVADPNILVARAPDAAQPTYLFLFIAFQDNFADSVAGNRVAVLVERILGEPAAADQPSAAAAPTGPLDAAALAERLAREGRVALHAIRFAFDGAVIEAGASEQLEGLAQMLSADPDLTLWVVGHTDDSGDLDANLALSRRRAEAVVDALIRSYGILGERLSAQGVGQLAPLASNRTEAGRALNRRIELVLRR